MKDQSRGEAKFLKKESMKNRTWSEKCAEKS
jgi:hypothetical protein